MNDARRSTDRRVRRAVEVPVRHALEGVPGPLVVAVSGGPDSLALLFAVRRIRADLVVAHFDHGLRDEAAADAEFVQGIAKQLDCAFETAVGDVREAAKLEHRSIEDAARRLRYAFLSGVARKAGATSVLVGHTANDQAESVLMHIIRGAGIRGLRGMSAVDPWPFGVPGLAVHRPLLGVRREETAAYCDVEGVSPRIDAMNSDRRYARTRVRLDVIPALEAINLRVVEALCRLAEAARAVDSEQVRPAGTALLASAGVTEPASALIRALSRLEAAPPGRRLDVGRGAVVTRVVDGVVAGEPVRGAVGGSAMLLRPGTQAWGDWTIEVGGSPGGEGWMAELPPGELSVRMRCPGDRIAIGPGMSKKLQDLFVDARVPRYDRAGWPVVCIAGNVAWVPGVRIAWNGSRPDRKEHVVVRVRRVRTGP